MLSTIKYWPQFKAEKHIFQPYEAVISITDPDIDEVVLRGAERILRLKFVDVEDITSDMKPELCYQETQGVEIRKFIDTLPDYVTDLIVHCAMGVSRSAAVALAIEAYTGAILDNREGAFDANKLVLSKLTKTFDVEKEISLPPFNLSAITTHGL